MIQCRKYAVLASGDAVGIDWHCVRHCRAQVSVRVRSMHEVGSGNNLDQFAICFDSL